MNTKTPAERLEDYRWKNRMQVGELADHIGISIAMTSRILRGLVAPGPVSAALIKKATGIRFPSLAKAAKRSFSMPLELDG